jgi:hypothetical protein
MPGAGTTKDKNDACHSGFDPESRHKALDTGRLYEDVFSYQRSCLQLNRIWEPLALFHIYVLKNCLAVAYGHGLNAGAHCA